MLQLGRRKLEFRKMLLVAALYLEARDQGEEVEKRLGWERHFWKSSVQPRAVCPWLGHLLWVCTLTPALLPPKGRHTHSLYSLLRIRPGGRTERGFSESSQGRVPHWEHLGMSLERGLAVHASNASLEW